MGWLDDILGGAGKKQEALGKDIKHNWRFLEGKQKADWGTALSYLTDSIGARNQGFDRARQQLDQVGAGARRGIMDSYKRNTSQLSSNLQASGLGNTTVAPSLQRGLAGDAQRQMSDLDSQLAGMYAQFEQNAGNARAMGLESLANFWTSRNDAMNSLVGRRLDFMAGIQYENDISIQDIAAIGSMFGGGGGGGGGGKKHNSPGQGT